MARRLTLRSCGPRLAGGLNALVAGAQALDQVGHVGELLLEIALVALEPLEHVVTLVPARPELSEPASAVSTVVHRSPPFRHDVRGSGRCGLARGRARPPTGRGARDPCR